jgi:type III secretion system YscQ/HrcQ family protein
MRTHEIEPELGRLANPAGGQRRTIRLREVEDSQALLARRLGTGLHAEMPLDATAMLRLEAGSLRRAAPASAHRPLLMQTHAGVLALSPAREILRALTAIDVPDNPHTDPLHQLRHDIATQAMPAGWLPLFGASTYLVGEATAPGLQEVTLTISQRLAHLGIEATLRGSNEALLHALSQPGWRHIDNGALMQLHDGLPLNVPVPIGTTELSLSALEALASGDVVIVSRPCFDLSGEGELKIAHGLAKCVLELGNRPRLEITEWHPMTAGPTMNESPHRHAHPGTTRSETPIDDLSVTLSFELGALDLPLSELRTLAPGSLLNIAGAMPPQVAICAGNRCIGLGELVELDGRLAVEIRRIGALS